MIRLDVFLKSVGLFRQRREARRACDEGRILVDGRLAKAARPVKVGEVIRIEESHRWLEAEVLDLPERPPSRAERERYCRVLGLQQRQDDGDLAF
jgi:ribosomal 50S subunit-recycling heat shock protein